MSDANHHPQAPQLSWRDGDAPFSEAFGDIYFNPEHGEAESRAVFLDGVGLPESWRGRARFVVGETGFGTGLNFLLTAQLWLQSMPPSARLHFVSVEAFPLSAEQLRRALGAFPGLSDVAAELIAQWPPAIPGFHTLVLASGRITLHLLLGEAEAMLANLCLPPTARVDAWYLDGFAPARNPQMWRPAVLRQIARLSAPGAKLATFTAVGQVRRDLESLGFAMAKTPGFGDKRERLIGTYRADAPTPSYAEPWFAPSEAPRPDGPIAIIGAGVAGCASAHLLRQAGREVILIDRHAAVGQEASGNPSGIFMPRLTLEQCADNRLHAMAWVAALNLYERAYADDPVIWRQRGGILQLPEDEKEAGRFGRMLSNAGWPEDQARRVTPAQARALSGLPAQQEGIWYAQAGCLWPGRLCQWLANSAPQRLGREVAAIARHGETWILRDADGGVIAEAAAVISALGATGGPIAPDLPLQAMRGQLSLLTPRATRAQRSGALFGGYLTPPYIDEQGQTRQVLGATFAPWDNPSDAAWRTLHAADHAFNLQQPRDQWPALADILPETSAGGRAALRAATPDHLPVSGPLPDAHAYISDYAKLYQGKRGGPFPAARYAPGLFALGGLGSRGLLTGPLMARQCVATLLGAPWPLPMDVARHVHPARFLVRKLKKQPPDLSRS
ncbi:bifunctional tRNA (5-methylaminomethyl-2-thiouridine)(34)-methyltransferase MnmD/FAD-dependent 5-carboxymethylaminomethyl-2-thiouridine(34) oxidoreductase MnmC [Magnetofaba australis]|uniref:tRNA 5-methylaminomethyl-2-thiouridine biosynthesis bifunctional protein MnmC n=1 Tax=Magnetofaba australis IT-1 TaxID=1434232 RepID=A0A1Y2K5X6_9PROT|nr:bifunctional tRNA (5-methylaminomethyl-2-thiouridine)(34)-methyltransferase MnmD/FAD-dependent 5-carboxymethylaminomethyl-2-thiouridine(34) oxidoreductase MnmC [Magnetofaba australis]OSM02514.1 putative tRNA 5-methylaminomethyl-2-thiouridine biosynthesis bifunctional protein [Magnetofaba australis IT-1]